MTFSRRILATIALGLALGLNPVAANEDLVVVAHPSVPRLDLQTLQRLYTGRAVEVGGQSIVVGNAAPGSSERQRFLAQVLQLDDDRYRAYWTVRRHVGKGTPPRELRNAEEVADFVRNTPGAVAYLKAADLRPGMNVVARP